MKAVLFKSRKASRVSSVVSDGSDDGRHFFDRSRSAGDVRLVSEVAAEVGSLFSIVIFLSRTSL